MLTYQHHPDPRVSLSAESRGVGQRIHLSRADVGPVEAAYVMDALRSGWIAPLGPHVDAFETEVAARVGVRHALALSSGTAALHLALLGAGAGPGAVVVCSTMTFAASANAIVYSGSTPVFVDSALEDGNLDAELLLKAVRTLQEEGTTVAAVLAVDLFGRCADYRALTSQLAGRGVALIEDAAESLGSRLDGRPAGSFGRAAALSFNGNKVMTTSGGGMLLSDDADLVERARYLATQARQPTPWYEHTEVGYNYRLSNLLAALGRAQLSRLDEMIARRVEIRQRYRAALAGRPGVRFLGVDEPDRHQDNSWLTTLVLDPVESGVTADELIEGLQAHDIESRHLWKPMHLQPVFAGARAFTNGASEQLFSRGVALPSGSSLTDDDVDRVLTALLEVLGR